MNDWYEKLEYSMSAQQQFDQNILKQHIPNCLWVKKTDIEQDKRGIDYVARLDNGAEVLIDAKTRTPGSKKYWRGNEAELALEIYSVVEEKKIGWTLNTATNVDYILYTFDRKDWDKYYFIPFQLLRKTFYENGKEWSKQYPIKKQASNYWHSSCMFVPVSVVMKALYKSMYGYQ